MSIKIVTFSVPEILVDSSHRIYLGKLLKDLFKKTSPQDKKVSMVHFNDEGCKGTRDFLIMDLPNANSAVESFKVFLKERARVSYHD